MSQFDEKPSGLMLVAVCASIFAGLPFEGWTVSLLWHWFVAPLGPPDIGLWHAIGLMVLVNMLALNATRCRDNRDERERAGMLLTMSFGVPAFVLAAGGFARWMMP